eukprot:GHVR01190877.1.p1 GENE.GHVR01190877.1~~GHVR01190877.1.p1  ORF type:complete len:218 (+),score=55.30 GHVR01190877.1:209-862(+)
MLQTLKYCQQWSERVDIACVNVRAHPNVDSEECLPVCGRCMVGCPLLRSNGDSCANCNHPFVRSFLGFEVLPLVEFTVEEGISKSDITRLLNATPPANTHTRTHPLTDDEGVPFDDDVDIFVQGVVESGTLDMNTQGYTPFIANRELLRSIPTSQVFVSEFSSISPLLKDLYHRNMLPEVVVAPCKRCGHFFHQDALELEWLQKKCCPFCGSPDIQP